MYCLPATDYHLPLTTYSILSFAYDTATEVDLDQRDIFALGNAFPKPYGSHLDLCWGLPNGTVAALHAALLDNNNMIVLR